MNPTFKSPRFILRAVEALLSFLVLALSAAFIAAWPLSNVNFALFVGLTSTILSIVFAVMCFRDSGHDRKVLIAEFVITILYWIFWLAAGAATADSVANLVSGNGLAGITPANCADIPGRDWCFVLDRLPSLKACCAFCWITWALWSASLFINVKIDILENRIFGRQYGDSQIDLGPRATGGIPLNDQGIDSSFQQA